MTDNINENRCSQCGASLTDDKKGVSIASLVLGILSIFMPLFGTVSAVVGLILGTVGLQDKKKKMAIVGIVLNSIAYIAYTILIAIMLIDKK